MFALSTTVLWLGEITVKTKYNESPCLTNSIHVAKLKSLTANMSCNRAPNSEPPSYVAYTHIHADFSLGILTR